MFLAMIRCVKCFIPIVLPQTTSMGGFPWPADGQPRNLICLGCLQAFQYYPSDVRRDWSLTVSSGAVASQRVVYFVDTKCSTGGCTSHIRLNVIADKVKDSRPLSQIVKGKAEYAGSTSCSNRHQAKGAVSGILAIGPDSDWPHISPTQALNAS